MKTMKRLAYIAIAGVALAAYSDPEVSLSWQDNSQNEAGFSIERSPDGEAFQEIGLVGVDVEAYVDSTVEAGETYHYRVRAFNEYGYSGYSNTLTVLVEGPPDDPQTLQGEQEPTLIITVNNDGTIDVEPAGDG